jgi:hypothetical protein
MILPSNPGFRYVGRFGNLGTDSVSIGWSNSMIECFFTGTSVGIQLEDPGENYFNYIIDSGPPIRKSSTEGEIVSGLSSGEHTLQIIKSTESDWEGPVKFKGLDVESIKEKPAEKSRKIFVSGASVSQGYGNMGCCEGNTNPYYTTGPGCSGGDVPDCCPEVPLYQDAYYIYSAFLAREYDADLVNIGASGTGITKNFDEISPYAPDDVCTADKPVANDDTLPYIFTKQLITESPNSFTDWDSYVPDAVFIDAGSNDFTQWGPSGGGSDALRIADPGGGIIGDCSPTEEGFKTATKKWITDIFDHWPKTHVFMIGWINSCAATRCPLFKEVADEMDNPQVHFFDLSSLDSLDKATEAGCNAHPLGYSPVSDISVHEEAANMINDKGFGKILNWTEDPSPPVSATSASTSVPHSSKLSKGAIIGIVIGAIALIAIIALVIWMRH